MSSRSLVLIPADYATNVDLAVRVATALAAPEATDVHVVEVTPKSQPWHALEDANNSTGAIRDARLRGDAERMIPGYAQLIGARAIVVDRHYGTTPLWRSTAVVARMSRVSPVPVLVLPSEGPALERWADGHVRGIVAAVDTTLSSAVALRSAIALATRHDARLTMLHRLDTFSAYALVSGNEALRVAHQLPGRRHEVAAGLVSQASRLGHRAATAQVVTGDPAAGILSAASDANADLIVMGVAPRSWIDRRLFGSTLDDVLRRAGVPVLVIPVVGGAEEWSEATISQGVMAGIPSQSTSVRVAA